MRNIVDGVRQSGPSGDIHLDHLKTWIELNWIERTYVISYNVQFAL